MDDYLPTADKMWSSSLTVEHRLTHVALQCSVSKDRTQ